LDAKTRSFSENKIVSSAYWRKIIPPGQRLEQSPLIRFALEALISILVKTSTTKLKRSGERGSPCLSPLPVTKKFSIALLSLTPTEPFVVMALIQAITLGQKPVFWRMSKRKTTSTLSKAFS
jgi:hypothetical protein